jgi:hypothetical protein
MIHWFPMGSITSVALICVVISFAAEGIVAQQCGRLLKSISFDGYVSPPKKVFHVAPKLFAYILS